MYFSTSSGLEQNVLGDQVVYYKSINQVFAGWDFGLYKEKATRVKKSLIRLEIIVSSADILSDKETCCIHVWHVSSFIKTGDKVGNYFPITYAFQISIFITDS